MFKLHVSTPTETKLLMSSLDIRDLIAALVLTVCANKDYPFGAITTESIGQTMVICKASPSKGLVWYNINGILVTDCPDLY